MSTTINGITYTDDQMRTCERRWERERYREALPIEVMLAVEKKMGHSKRFLAASKRQRIAHDALWTGEGQMLHGAVDELESICQDYEYEGREDEAEALFARRDQLREEQKALLDEDCAAYAALMEVWDERPLVPYDQMEEQAERRMREETQNEPPTGAEAAVCIAGV